MIIVWLFAQTMVASHAQAHSSLGHGSGAGTGYSAVPAEQDYSGQKMHHKANSHDGMDHQSGDTSDNSDKCCGVPCQSTQASASEPFGSMRSPEKPTSFHLTSNMSWAPSSQTPPPNPSI